MATVPEALSIALQHHRAGRLSAAEQIYRQILQVDPHHADALHLLGMIAYQVGKHEIAVEYIGRAIELQGNVAEFHINLGNVCKDQRRLDDAIASYRRGLALKPDLAEAHNNLGVAFTHQEKHAEAVACFRRALALKGDFAEACKNLGGALVSQGKSGEAAAWCRRALELEPASAEACNVLGHALTKEGKLEEAVACLRRAVELNPAFAEAHDNLGSALQEQGRGEEAIASYRRALELRPGFAEAHNHLGVAFANQGKLDAAIDSYHRALACNPGLIGAHNNLGAALRNQGKLDDAVASGRRAVELAPDLAAAHCNLGLALKDQMKLEEAVGCFRRAVELDPGFAAAHFNLGHAFRDQRKLDEAVAAFRRALELQPEFATAHSDLGVVFIEQGKLDAAIASGRRALELEPDSAAGNYNLAVALLAVGCYEEAWARYESRIALFPPRGFAAPRWNGESAEGQTILVHFEQWFGDTLQFVRYVRLLRERAMAARVILECQPELARLLSHSLEGEIEVVAHHRGDHTHLPPFDWHLPLWSLPFSLRLFEPLPMSAPYLRADPAMRATWRERLGPPNGRRVGLIWTGNRENAVLRHRSIQADRLLPLLRQPGMTFYSLVVNPSAADLPPLVEAGLVDLTKYILDFADTAAFMAELDLIISIDTAGAHLAGALGRPVWTLLQFVSDWRWGPEGESTPWYPTMRLFRQSEPGRWNAVLQRIDTELGLLNQSRAHT